MCVCVCVCVFVCVCVCVRERERERESDGGKHFAHDRYFLPCGVVTGVHARGMRARAYVCAW